MRKSSKDTLVLLPRHVAQTARGRESIQVLLRLRGTNAGWALCSTTGVQCQALGMACFGCSRSLLGGAGWGRTKFQMQTKSTVCSARTQGAPQHNPPQPCVTHSNLTTPPQPSTTLHNSQPSRTITQAQGRRLDALRGGYWMSAHHSSFMAKNRGLAHRTPPLTAPSRRAGCPHSSKRLAVAVGPLAEHAARAPCDRSLRVTSHRRECSSARRDQSPTPPSSVAECRRSRAVLGVYSCLPLSLLPPLLCADGQADPIPCLERARQARPRAEDCDVEHPNHGAAGRKVHTGVQRQPSAHVPAHGPWQARQVPRAD